MSTVEIQDITKSYGDVQALKGISLEVTGGELFGLIGPDGAGKTTIFRILTTLLKPDSGRASVLGRDVVTEFRAIRPRLGYMPGRFSLYQDLSVEENLDFFASVFGTTVDINYALIKPIYRHLKPFRQRLAGALSGGMKQKLALCCALIHKPELLFLDEPTTGVDAVSRKEFWQMLHRLKEEGITIVVSTPYMDEARQCGRIALIQDGRILSVAPPQDVIRQFEGRLWGIKARDKYALIRLLRDYPFSNSVQPFGEYIHYTDKRPDLDGEELKSYLRSKGVEQPVVREISPGIEDTFIQLMEESEHG